MIGIANVFSPLFFLEVHALLFPSLLLHLSPFVAIPPLLLQFKLKTGIMQEVMGCGNGGKTRIVVDSHPSLLRSAAKKKKRKRKCRYWSKQALKRQIELLITRGQNKKQLFSIFSAPLASIYCTSPAGEIKFQWAPLGWEQNGPARTSIH